MHTVAGSGLQTDRLSFFFILLTVFFVSNLSLTKLSASVPDVKAQWIDNPPGTPDPTLILFVPCQTRTLRVNVTTQPTTAYYLWVNLPSDLEVVTLPSYSTIIEDPIYTGQYWIEIYFPPNPLSNNPDKDIVFGLRNQNHVAVSEELLCHSFLEREADEWPEEYESKTMYVSWEKITYISGSPVSLEDLVLEEEVTDPDDSHFTRQNLIVDGELLVDVDYEFGGLPGFPTRFYMLEESKISISSSTLILTGTVLNTCNNIWEGISVESGGILLTGHQNEIGNIGRVEIHDAIAGISLENESTADIRKTDFLDNRVGIVPTLLSARIATEVRSTADQWLFIPRRWWIYRWWSQSLGRD
ncbi:MAG: hypothetical protein IPJ06_01615 [Saprospiraceae bacterium]|nr:hypothetical protein [Saprospiraceae bacterium]